MSTDIWDEFTEQPPDNWLRKWRGDYAHVEWIEQRRCNGRGHPRRGPGVFILVNGVKQVLDHCLDCGKAFGALGNKGFNCADLPLIGDNRRNQGACPHPVTEPALVIAADGRERWRLICTLCLTQLETLEHPPPGGRLANRVIDHRVDTDGFAIAPPCDHCGAHEGTQLHHWAPRALFKDADRWPTAWLCCTCHDHWHRIVTPTLVHGEAR